MIIDYCRRWDQRRSSKPNNHQWQSLGKFGKQQLFCGNKIPQTKLFLCLAIDIQIDT